MGQGAHDAAWARRSSSPESPPGSARGSANSRSRSAPTSSASTSTRRRGRSTPSSRPTSARPRAWPRSLRRCRERFDALCNVAGVSGMIGAAKTLAINFYGLRALTRSARAAAARGRRGRQCRLNRRLWLARQSRARQGVLGRARISRSRPAPRGASSSGRGGLSAVEGAAALVDHAGRASAVVQGPRIAGERREPRPGDDADPQGISPDLRRSARRRRHRARRPRGLRAGYRARGRCSCARTARAGSTAPICRSTAASKPRSTPPFSDFSRRRAWRGD